MRIDKLTIYMGGQTVIINSPTGSGNAIMSAMIKGDLVWDIKDVVGARLLLNPKVIAAVKIEEIETQ